MKNGDISNVSSPQVVCVTDVTVKLKEEVSKRLLIKKLQLKISTLVMVRKMF
jgi:hypothetical protein